MATIKEIDPRESQPEVARPDCFVIMPVTEPDGYVSGHFTRVFEDIFAPACNLAGYRPIRADQVKETNFIHLDVLQRLLSAPMVLCDLSSRNPNVLFELGLRQAFDRPVVLVQEQGTPKIFDIAPLRYTEYRQARTYHEVLEDQRAIADALAATKEAFAKGSGINSLVRILSLTQPASIVEIQEASKDPSLQLIRAELNELRNDIQRAVAIAMPRRSDYAEQGRDLSRLRNLSNDIDSRLIKMRKGGEPDPELPELIVAARSLAGKMASSVSEDSEWQQMAHLVNKLKIMEQEYLSLTGQSLWDTIEQK